MNLPRLPGPSVQSAHVGWFELKSISGFSTAGGIMPPVLIVTRQADKNSVALLQALADATLLSEVTIEFCDPGMAQTCRMSYLLSEVTVTSLTVAQADRLAGPLEAMTLRFNRLRVSQKTFGNDGSSTEATSETLVFSNASKLADVEPYTLQGVSGGDYDGYAKIGTLTGSVVEMRHTGWSALDGLVFTASRGDTGVKVALSFLKGLDVTSPGLLVDAGGGKQLPVVTAELCLTQGPTTGCMLNAEVAAGASFSYTLANSASGSSWDKLVLGTIPSIKLSMKDRQAPWTDAAVFTWP